MKEEDLEIEHRVKVPQGVHQIFQESDQKVQVNFQLANSFTEILEQRCKPLSETLMKGAKVQVKVNLMSRIKQQLFDFIEDNMSE